MEILHHSTAVEVLQEINGYGDVKVTYGKSKIKEEKKNSNVEQLSDVSYYQKLTNTSGLRKEHENPRELNYEALYTSWATDLLPEEFDENDIYFERDEDIIYYLGSVGESNGKHYL